MKLARMVRSFGRPCGPLLRSKLALVLSGILLPLSLHAQTASHWLTGYYAVYDQNGTMTTAQLDYTKLTHVIYWPVIPNTGTPGTLDTTAFVSASTFASGATDIVSRAHAAGGKALIGIGGDEYTPVGDKGKGATAGFKISTQPAYQATFINNIIALMQQYHFDGVDINWEQIQTSDNSDFTTFITNLRSQMNTVSTSLILTMAPETKTNGGRPDLLSQVYQYLDQVNIQTYQMSGAYCGFETWYNSPLNGGYFALEPSEPLPTITNAVADYTSTGIPIGKLAMGIQFDSVIWTGGAGTSTGGVTQPHQTWTNDAANCGTNPAAPVVTDLTYRDTIAKLTASAGYTTNFDSQADQTWLSYDPSGTGTTNEANDSWVSLDSPTSIAKKGVDLSAGTGQGGTLGGAFLFELSDDFMSAAPAAQQHPLLNASASMQMLLPGLVTGLSATPGTGSASLTWTAAPFANAYKIYYSTTSTTLGTLSATVSGTTATVNGLTGGPLYYFTVVPTDFFGSSAGTQASATVNGGSALTLSRTSYPFASTAVGSSSATHGFSITNSSNVTVTGLAISLTGANPTDFIQSNACSSTLAAGASCAVTAAFKPLAVGSFTANLSVTSSGGNGTVAFTGTGTAAAATDTLSPASYTFANTAIGSTSAAQTFTLTNTDTSTLTGIAVSLTGANPTDFSKSTTCGTTLAANASCNISVSFTPASAAAFTATLSVASNAATATSSLSGTGTASALTLSRTSYPFASTAVGSSSATHGFSITNSSNVTVTGLAISLTGANPTDFIQSNACSSTLAAGASCAVTAAFKPLAVGSFTANLSVTSSGGNGTVAFTGTGTAAAATDTLSPASYTFANTAIGSTSAAQTFTLTNTDTSTLTGIAVSLTGANPTDFSKSTTCGTTLAANASCNISVSFTPASAAAFTATLSVASNAATATSSLSGTGTASALTLSRTSYPFASTAVGSSSATHGFGITNSSNATVTGLTVSITGANPTDFIQTNACSSTLAAGASCEVTAAFKPLAVGSFTANLSVTSSGGDGTVAFTGTGTTAAANRIVWVPDFYSGVLNVEVGTSNNAISISLPACSPNAVAVNSNYAFVLCTAYNGQPDKILVYNAAPIRSAPAGPLNITPVQTYLGGAAGSATAFSGLIAGAFDPSGNLWITSSGNNLVLSISASSLGTANPVFTQQLNDSPSYPTGITFASDGSAWLTGEVNGAGIALNFTPDQFADGGQIPRYCLLAQDEGAGSSCQLINGIFESPEGIAIVGGDIWVANNGVGGTTPGRQLVDLKIVDGSITVNGTFGDPNNPAASHFVCPGALFSTPVHLWINDESYGESTANLHCGGNGDVAGSAGGIFAFTPSQLAAQDTTIADVLVYANITGRPGFGGLFVESDQ